MRRENQDQRQLLGLGLIISLITKNCPVVEVWSSDFGVPAEKDVKDLHSSYPREMPRQRLVAS